ncbi:hypothetical protein J3T65_11355 [Staphylococcus simiae]|uniref:hypothetical protein n=1 Tax=Staphylococcus simiae TaxID=308354 RepID=UPI001A962958|nr:hypothetical protein [Staphylococcus simiae]MBO1199939.1 hypothetical protein [Staphylococcus simiae]MBO1202208.1 hypothetical protein [Staphylococcus simiae]MBO1204466.1 hypothetical protein [Staphylococcus simiae]MBO1212006.1 hypothetical protein [Staphylococcus simiae]MBO1230644.1 hypothetical protein [Staphylococcus simiae]
MRIPNSYGHDVLVILDNDKELSGFVIGYDNPFENDSGNFSMDLKTSVGIWSLDESEIKEIKLLDK